MEPIRFPFDAPPGPGEVTEVTQGILWARLPLPMTLDHVNVYVLDDGDGWAVVDTGLSARRCREAWEALLAGPLTGKPVTKVLLTHHHPDHLGLVGWFQARGAELITTRTAWLFGRMLTLDEQEEMTPESETFFLRAGMDPERLAKRKADRPFNFADVVHPIPLGFRRIKQDDRITLGGRDWTIHVGNGHAPEHATLWSEDGIVLAGDQIIPGISSNLGVYATEPDADPVGDWIESCTRLCALARPEHLALPGHKMPFTGVATRLSQLIDNHEMALPRLVDLLREPKRAGDCFPLLYKRSIGDGEYGLALVEAVGHLNHLLKRGLITREVGPDGAYLWRTV